MKEQIKMTRSDYEKLSEQEIARITKGRVKITSDINNKEVVEGLNFWEVKNETV